MSNRAFWLILALFLSYSLLMQAPDANALAIAHSDLTFSGLQIVPEAGTISLVPNWQFAAFAEAKNSLGEEMQQFDGVYSTGNALANAIVTWADGFARVSVPHCIPDFEFSDTTESNINLPGGGEQAANSLGRGFLYTTLYINGGTGPVDVDFSGELSGYLSVKTDQYGVLAKADAIFGLMLDDMHILPYEASLSIGPNDEKQLIISREFAPVPVTLEFGTPYSLWIEVADFHSTQSA